MQGHVLDAWCYHCRVFDYSNEGFKGWEFMTVHCWGERAAGEWTLEIRDTPSQVRHTTVQGKGPPAAVSSSLVLTSAVGCIVFRETVLPKFLKNGTKTSALSAGGCWSG